MLSGTINLKHLVLYLDTSFTLYLDEKGHIGMVPMWNNSALIIESKEQKISTKDSTKGKLVSPSTMVVKVEWPMEYVTECGYQVIILVIFCDNTYIHDYNF